MKFIEKVSLTIFSVVILILSLVLSLMLFGWLETSDIYYALKYIIANPTATKIALGASIVFMLLAIKCIFFPSYNKTKDVKVDGILLENEAGKLLISIDTLESLVKGVISGFENIKSANCKVKLDKQVNNVIISLILVVSGDTIIKELSANLQDRIKEVIKKTTDVEVKEVTIKIKNIEEIKPE